MATSLKQLSLLLLACGTLTTAHAGNQDALTPRALACTAVQNGSGYADPGELVRELYRIVSAPAGAAKDWVRLRSLHAPGAGLPAIPAP